MISATWIDQIGFRSSSVRPCMPSFVMLLSSEKATQGVVETVDRYA